MQFTWVRALKQCAAVLGAVAMMAVILSGCGGNPSGPESASAVASATVSATRIVGKIVTTDTGVNIGLGGIIVNLIQNDVPIATYTSESSGDYFFNLSKDGVYVIKTQASGTYKASSIAVEAKANTTTTAPNVSVLGPATTATTTAIISASTRLLGRVVSANSGTNSGLGGIAVSLVRDANVIGTYTTETSGDYYFNDLKEGVYVLRTLATGPYQTAAVVVEVKANTTVTAPNLAVFSTQEIGDTPTLDICGTFTSALDGSPLSVAQVSLDSGQTTVTNAFGYFYFAYVGSGSRKLSLAKPGLVSSYTISFEVRGTATPTADKIIFQGQGINPVVNNETAAFGTTSWGVARLIQFGNLPITYDLNSSSILTGTVLLIVKDSSGKLTNKRVPVPGFAFELWTFNSVFNKYTTVVTNASGEWKVDNIPPSDNTWLAVATSSYENHTYDNTGAIVNRYMDNTRSPWRAVDSTIRVDGTPQATFADPSFTSGPFKAVAGKTTIMDIQLPDFFPYPYNP